MSLWAMCLGYVCCRYRIPAQRIDSARNRFEMCWIYASPVDAGTPGTLFVLAVA